MGQKKHKYPIHLPAEERASLNRLKMQGRIQVRKLKRAQILLLADENHSQGNKTDKEIAEKLDVGAATIERVRRNYVEAGLEAALNEKERRGRPRQIDGSARAKVTALACSTAPEGYARWTLRLLAEKVVELEILETISYTTVGEILKKNIVQPQRKLSWCIGELTAAFLCQMEEMLYLYQLPYDPLRPLWCFDERPCQLIGDTLVPLPLEAGKPLRQNYEYERNGACSILFAVQPHTGRCFVQVRQQRTARDYAEFMQALNQAHCPPGGQIILVQDNLNTHTPASFYTAFTPEVAFALKQQFEVHYTPKKASWLNMAEIELSVLSKQCLDRRIPDIESLEREVLTWVRLRNEKPLPIRWQFTPELARQKFKRFYPNPSKFT